VDNPRAFCWAVPRSRASASGGRRASTARSAPRAPPQ
jgi:hypothetical protein